MKRINPARALSAGLGGTAAMTIIAAMAPMMGLPPMSVPVMLSSFMGVPTVIGWIMHFMVGTVLALLYAVFASRRLPGPPWLRGTIFSLLPWFVAQVILNPIMGAGAFAANTPAPFGMVMGSLIGHVMFGAVVGAIYAHGTSSVARTAHA